MGCEEACLLLNEEPGWAIERVYYIGQRLKIEKNESIVIRERVKEAMISVFKKGFLYHILGWVLTVETNWPHVVFVSLTRSYQFFSVTFFNRMPKIYFHVGEKFRSGAFNFLINRFAHLLLSSLS